MPVISRRFALGALAGASMLLGQASPDAATLLDRAKSEAAGKRAIFAIFHASW